MFNLMKISRW